MPGRRAPWPWRSWPQLADTHASPTASGDTGAGPRWLPMIGLGAAYYLLGWGSIELAMLPDSQLTLVWPASGIALAAVLHYGYRAGAVIFIASAALNLPPVTFPDGSPWTLAASTVLIGLGGALEPALAVLLIRRFAVQRLATSSFLLAMLVAVPIGVAVGAAALIAGWAVASPALAADPIEMIRRWHGVGLADYIGMVVVAPPVWLWLNAWPRPIRPRRLPEAVAYLALAAIALGVREPIQPYFLLFVVYVALAIRTRLHWATVAISAISIAILWLTVIGRGPIVGPTPYATFLATLTFVFALNVASCLIALLWRDLQHHRDHLENLVHEQTRELEAANTRLEHLARVDPLTGAWNRRHLDECLRHECERAKRSGKPLCLVTLDIDHFKAINDRHGHAAGDAVLETVAGRLAARLRAADVLARTGGEEFTALLVDCDTAGGARTAERLRAALADAPVTVSGQAIRVTASAGVVAWSPARSADRTPERMVKTALQLADRRLYEAKRAGRDRVAAGPAAPEAPASPGAEPG